jgi:hypothetical protein
MIQMNRVNHGKSGTMLFRVGNHGIPVRCASTEHNVRSMAIMGKAVQRSLVEELRCPIRCASREHNIGSMAIMKIRNLYYFPMDRLYPKALARTYVCQEIVCRSTKSLQILDCLSETKILAILNEIEYNRT